MGDVDLLAQAMYLGSTPPPAVGPEHPDAVEWMSGARRWTIEQIEGKLEDSTTYVIMADGTRVGRLRVVRSKDRHMVGGIQILPGHRGRGIGTAVLTRLLDEAFGNGLPLDLDVSKDNPEAERLYARLGFRRTGERAGDEFCMRALPPSRG